MSEEKKFSIGGFEFENYYEYRAAQEDVQKIECINEELDVQDPEVAVRLYNDIRDGIISFNSPIGQQFADHVADIVANKSVDLLDDRALIMEAEGQVKHQKAFGLLFVCLGIVAFLGFAGYEIKENYTTWKMAKLKEEVAKNSTFTPNENTNNADMTIGGDQHVVVDGQESGASANQITEDLITSPWDTNYTADQLAMFPEFAELYSQNPDFVGWLEIVDTDINYPVMQTPNDPEYYLRRNFNGEEDSNGTLFVDYRCDLINPTTNTIIFGHNMRSGKMFGPLKKYLDYEYYQAHKTINFKTLYFEEQYEIVGVGLSSVGYSDDSSYKYYEFIDAVTGSEFQDFLDNIQSLSVYDETIDIKSTDKLLTLSTCNSYKEDGRLFVVAKRVQ